MLRSRSAATTAGSSRSSNTSAGAVSNSDFEDAFNNVKPEKVHTEKDLVSRLTELNAFLLDSSKEWNKKGAALTALRGCLVAPVPRVVDVVIDNAGVWERCLIDGLKELRSSLNKEYCITVAYFCTKIGPRFIRQVELLMPNLMSLVQNSAKIMSSAGLTCSEILSRYVCHGKLIGLIAGYVTHKASQIRRNVIHLTDIILSEWDRSLVEPSINIISAIIKGGLTDADASCRQTSKNAYFVLCEKFPNQATTLFESLDVARQRALGGQKSAASSSQSIVNEDERAYHGAGQSRFMNQQSAFLANRSRSELFNRTNNVNRASKPANNHSRNNSPTRATPIAARVRQGIGYSKPPPPKQTLFRPNIAPPKTTAPKASAALSGPRSQTPIPHAQSKANPILARAQIARTNGTTATPAGPPSAFGFRANPQRFVPPKAPNIREPIFTAEQKLIGIISTISSDNYSPNINDRVTDALKELSLLIQTGKISELQINEHFNALFIHIVSLIRETRAPNTLKIQALNALRDIIQLQPGKMVGKSELAVFRVLDAQDKDDAVLTRAADDCGAVVVQHLNVSQCIEILLPIVKGGNGVRPESIASALKLLGRKIESLNDNSDEVYAILEGTKDVVIKTYDHPESMVRRACILYFVKIANAIGTEPLKGPLSPPILKLVEVYRNKASQKENSESKKFI